LAENLSYKRLANLATAAVSIATLVFLTCMFGYMVGIDFPHLANRFLDLALIRIHEIFFS